MNDSERGNKLDRDRTSSTNSFILDGSGNTVRFTTFVFTCELKSDIYVKCEVTSVKGQMTADSPF